MIPSYLGQRMPDQTADYDINSEYVVTPPENLPEKPVNPSEELRQEMRRLCKESLYYLCKVVLGYDRLVPHVHMPMCDFCDQVKAKRRLKLMPRTHFKTTIWTIGLSIQDIIKNPNVTILLVADTSTNAKRFMREIQQHFEMNELFRWLFPELIPQNFNKTVWSQNEMLVPRTRVCREPTIDAMGAGAGIESRHYDIIRPDDLVTEKHIHSDVEMDTLLEWAGGLESLLNGVDLGIIDATGSRKKKGDLYEVWEREYGHGYEEVQIGPHATQRGDLVIYWRAAIEEGEPIFPEEVSMKFLNRLKRMYPERYHAQYANNPKASGLNVFNEEDLRYWRWSEDGSQIICSHKGEIHLKMSPFAGERILLYDPSRAEKKRSSYNAILVLLKGYPIPFRIVLEAHIGHYLPDRAIEILLEMDKKWRPTLHSIEHRGYQGAIKYWLSEKTERDGIPMPPLLMWPPEGSPKAQWAKEEHIKAIQPLTRTNMVWLHESQTELIEEFEFYPNVRYDDGVDCFSQSMDYWPALMSDVEMAESAQTEKDHLAAVLGYDANKIFEAQFDEEAMFRQLNATGYRYHQA